MKEIDFKIELLESKEDNNKYHVIIKIPTELGWIDSVKLLMEGSFGRSAFQMKHLKNEKQYAFFETTISLATKAIYHYYFSFEANSKFIYYKKKNQDSYHSISQDEMWKLSVNYKVPDWAKGKIMYHIFVDRFYRDSDQELEVMNNRDIHSSWDEDVVIGPNEKGIWNADFYGGNLKGILNQLDYLKSLGVGILYLSPIVWSQSNHRYDAADYEKVDPYAGNNEDLRQLCIEAHKRGMHVILDAVFNHTGNDSKYFNQYGNFDELGAYQSKDSKYYPFYRKYRDNHQTVFDYWWGMTNLPVCNGYSKEWQDYIYGEGGVIDLWFSLGIDGLRLDVADELSDEFIEGIAKAVKRNKEDGFILGEVWKNPMRMNRGYIESGKGMHSVMNYLLMDALIRYYKYNDIGKLSEILREIKTEYPEDMIYSLMNFTSTHDITRAINIFSTKEFQYNGEWAWNLNNDDRIWQKEYRIKEEDYQIGKKIYQSYVSALAFLPGNLSIFYGDEVGLQGMGNLANRRPYPWNKEDKELLEFFQKIGKIRNKETFLETADFDVLDINDHYLQFLRRKEKEEALVTISKIKNSSSFHIPNTYQEGEIIYQLGETDKEHLSPFGGIVLKKTKR